MTGYPANGNDIAEWLRLRGHVIRRVIHGRNKAEWLEEFGAGIGEIRDYALTQ